MALKLRKSAVAPPPMCPLSLCMKLLGGAWTPNVIWHLSAGPRRFGELRADIPPISAKVLSARLRELERRELVRRLVVASSPPSVEYSLTDLGQELMPVIHAIVQVGTRLREEDHHPPRKRARVRGAVATPRSH
jgi:DNA-binding HxlR family transcriptional regulator